MSVSLWNDLSKNKKINFDICIIGGGLAGLSTAFWLNNIDSSLRIGLVEKYQLGSGASGRNAGFITCGSVEHFNRLIELHGKEKAYAIWKFSEDNKKLLEEYIIQNDKDLGFENKGSFSLAAKEEEMKELKKSATLMKELNINVEILQEIEVKKRLGCKGFVGGVKYTNDGSIDPILLLNKIKSLSKITILEDTEVFDIETTSCGPIIKTNKTNISTDLCILATNAYSCLLRPYFKNKIYPTRGQIITTSSVESFMEGPCYANFVLDYFRQLPSGEVLIGGFRQLQKDQEIGFSDEITPVIQDALEVFLCNHLPALNKAKITHRWSGVMGFSADGQPIIGALPEDNQIMFLGGFTAHGLGLTFHSGKILAKNILNESTIPDFLSAKRF